MSFFRSIGNIASNVVNALPPVRWAAAAGDVINGRDPSKNLIRSVGAQVGGVVGVSGANKYIGMTEAPNITAQNQGYDNTEAATQAEMESLRRRQRIFQSLVNPTGPRGLSLNQGMTNVRGIMSDARYNGPDWATINYGVGGGKTNAAIFPAGAGLTSGTNAARRNINAL